IDKTSNNDIDIVRLHQTSAAQLATVITNLQNATRATGDTPQVSIAPDERSNSILISGNKAARLRTRLLITELDVPSAGASGNTQVVYLRYLQAKDFAPILGKIAQNIQSKDASMNNLAAISSIPGANSTSTKPENTTSIQAEPNTNSIIITAPPRLMTALTSIVSKLDIRPAQVLVESIIVEISQNDTKNLGIQWGSVAKSTSEAAVNTMGFLPLGIGSVGIIPSTQITAILGILQQTAGVNILSTPSVVVLDNQKAVLAVGTQVPDTSGSYATTGSSSTVTPFNTINRLNVELKLEVTPQINLGDSVRLKIILKNDSLQNPNNPGLNPIVNTSSINNSVLVNSDDILVLGGLISNNITSTQEKIPILGDIPLVGLLFQHDSRTLEKKNLMVFIKSSIIHNPEDAGCLTNNKYRQVRNTQINWPEDLTSKGKQKLENILPPWKNNVQLPKPFDN
ncbi:MAG TPA: secretin N-terminal domain-containing protein, partial [Gammaproteobacteria bacterium]|nr:secretin N-terminal domain-containing protein [Gammaproteobacteria bacterium]